MVICGLMGALGACHWAFRRLMFNWCRFVCPVFVAELFQPGAPVAELVILSVEFLDVMPGLPEAAGKPGLGIPELRE